MTDYRWVRFACVLSGASLILFLATSLISCSSGSADAPTTPPPPPTPLTAADVQQVVEDAAQSLQRPHWSSRSADRAGKILAVFQNAGAPPTSTGNLELPSTAKNSPLPSPAPQPSSATIRLRFRLAPCASSAASTSPRASRTPPTAIYTASKHNRGCLLNATFSPG